MQDIKTYFVALTFIYLYINNISNLYLKLDGVVYRPRNKFFGFLFTTKPFNCGMCISLWCGVALTLAMFNIFFLTLPLSFKFLNKFL